MKIFTTIFFLLILNRVSAQEKIFIKEYSYRASEMDSKISCRAIATNQLRSMILNEVGVYVKSESLLKTTDIGGKFSQDFVETISTISAGITSLVILEEKWDGVTFWMKASITVDEKEFEKSLKQLINDRQKVKDLETLKTELDKAKMELTLLTQKLNNGNLNKTPNDSIEAKYNNEIDVLTSTDFIYRGISKLNLEDYRGAIADFTESIRIDPMNSRSYFGRGISKATLQDYRGAITDYSKAIEIKPDYAKAYVLRGISKGVTPRPQGEPLDHLGAIADYTKAIEIEPSSAEGYEMRGATKAVLQNYQEAIIDYNKAIEIDINNTEVYVSRGLSKAKLQDYRGSISDFSSAIKIEPDNGEAFVNRGASKLNLQDYRGAITDLTRAIEIDPKNALAYINRGISRIALGQTERGCKDLSKAGELGDGEAYQLIRKYCN